MTFSKNQTYSDFNPAILDKKTRLSAGKKIIKVLEHNLTGKNLAKLTLLDIGCSSGIITDFVATRFGKVWGIDLDKKALKFALRSGKSKLLQMDATKMTFKDNSFDVVICNHIYYYLKESPKLIEQIYRVLKPGGICYFSGGSKYSLFKKDEGCPYYYLSLHELEKLMTKFKIRKYSSEILKNPSKYGYNNIEDYAWLFKLFPKPILSGLELLFTQFVWILEKPLA